jgi:2-oxo-4-hydroxy-4-carboxy-5-ureidoimidazoline decarboxylase
MSMSVMANLTLSRVAAMDRDAFVATFGDLFEHSRWVAEGAWESRPFESEAALHGAMMAVVRAVSKPQLLAFLNGHPELAGREAEAGTMTGHSTHEQRGAGLDALSREDVLELRRLNTAYRERHGFPFIIKALDHDQAEIFEALRTRTMHDTAQELREALDQVARITRRRLDAMFEPIDPAGR